MHENLIPVILAGGTGTRLWPVSREQHPKPFIQLPNGQTLLEKTYSRLRDLSASKILTITNKEYYFKSKVEFEKSTAPQTIPLHFLLEPCKKNTAPAIAFAALQALSNDSDSILLILPADHLIQDVKAFNMICEQAIKIASNNKLVTFGIKPTHPETGYGYIECGDYYTAQSCQIKRFIEKPGLEQAQLFLDAKTYLWNSGIFCFKASTFLQELALHAPDLLQTIQTCWNQRIKKNPSAIIELEPSSFAQIQDISIDYAVMEKSQNIINMICDFDWHDVGSWESFQLLYQKDEKQNTLLSDTILIDSENNFIFSEKNKMVASIGIKNLTIVDTADALLIADRSRGQDVKEVVQLLKKQNHRSYLNHCTVIRPWGSYTILEEGSSFKIKRLVVKPNASLSLQTHNHRSEHWVVVKGKAKVRNGDTEYELHTNESTFVPMKTPHRLSNPFEEELVIIEVQTGAYLEEDDIIRLEDNYGR